MKKKMKILDEFEDSGGGDHGNDEKIRIRDEKDEKKDSEEESTRVIFDNSNINNNEVDEDEKIHRKTPQPIELEDLDNKEKGNNLIIWTRFY